MNIIIPPIGAMSFEMTRTTKIAVYMLNVSRPTHRRPITNRRTQNETVLIV